MYDDLLYLCNAKRLREIMEKKYRTQVACSKKFVVGKFLNFKMNDAKPVVKQVEELQIIVHEMEVEVNILRWKKKITPNKRITTSRKFIIVGSVGNLGIKLRIVATRKSMEAEILEETDNAKKPLCQSPKNLLDVTELDTMFTGKWNFLKIEGKENKRSKRAKVTKDFGPDYMTYIVNEEPQTYKAAMESSEAPYWKEAIQSEIESIVHKNTWKLIDLPSGHKPICHKWIFKKKLRPDSTIEKYKAHLAYSVSRLSRYSHNPGRDHWDALVRVLQYLKHTMAYGLHYTKYPLVLEGYCDANWISNHNEGKSTSGYVFTLGGAAVSWKSSKQTVNTRSTMEAEFVALDKAAEEAEWLRSFLEGIPLWPKPVTAVCIHCDSMAALTRAKNHIYNGKSRHIRRRHNTIKDLLRNGIISIDYVKSKENIADPLTKGLCREQVIFTSRVEYYGIFLIGITYTRLMCGRIFGNQMAKVL
ncbi:DNA polymerase zeta catalytic subunit-like protein [Tanacetum coccineum]